MATVIKEEKMSIAAQIAWLVGDFKKPISYSDTATLEAITKWNKQHQQSSLSLWEKALYARCSAELKLKKQSTAPARDIAKLVGSFSEPISYGSCAAEFVREWNKKYLGQR